MCAACREPLTIRRAALSATLAGRPSSLLSPPTLEPLPPLVSLSTAVGLYDGRLRDVVHALKYDSRPTIAKHLSQRMARAGRDVLAGADVVVPVPLHRSRERSRGFNQGARAGEAPAAPDA